MNPIPASWLGAFPRRTWIQEGEFFAFLARPLIFA